MAEGGKTRTELLQELTDLRREIRRLRSITAPGAPSTPADEQNEGYFRKLAEEVNDWIWETDAEHTYTYCSPCISDILGYEPSEALGKTPYDFMPPEEAARARGAVQDSADAGGAFTNLESVYLHRDGHRVVLETSGVPIQSPADEPMGYRGITRDITTRKRAEDALVRERDFTTEVLQTVAALVVVLDAEGNIIRFNKTCEVSTGYTSDEVLGKKVWELFIVPEEVEAVSGVFRELRAGTFPSTYENFWLTKDGARRLISWSNTAMLDGIGDVEYVIATGIDVTERRAAEIALGHSEERFRTFIQNFHGIAYQTHVDTFAPILFEGRVEEITGYTLHDFATGFVKWSDLIHPDDIAMVVEESQSLKTVAGYVADTEYRIRARSGGTRWVNDVARALRPAADKGPIIQGAIYDITEHKRSEEEREGLQAQVQHVQKLESLGVLAGGIAHDFNNLLMAILGNADLAQFELPAGSPAKGNIVEIEKASRRAAELCRQMLAYSGRGKFVVESLDLSAIVEEMAYMLEISVSRKAILKYHFADEVPPVDADASQIRQIIMNLVTNASEAIGDRSGVISISTGAMECDRHYLAETYLDENLAEGLYSYIEVCDTGCGMTAETKSKLFDPFYTTKFTGRGLGLSAVLGIVRGHHGAIKVYSEVGKGTTIKVLFPVTGGIVFDAAAKEASGSWVGEGAVLLVDDEESVRAVGASMLKRLGFEVLTACDGREALEVFQENANSIVCVLLDLTMPHLDGEQTFRELRRVNKDVCVILSSGYNEQDVIQRFVGKNLAGFMQKPYKMDALRTKLKEVLGT
jgi:PAS domain S-box-containing protein